MIPYFSFNSIIIGPITIQIWGLFASIGFLFALYLSLKQAKKNNFDQNYIWDVFVIILIGMILGSKVLNIIFNLDKIRNIKDIFILSTGGFSLIGGISLSFIFLYIYTRSKRINIYKIIDNLILGAAVALMMTRIGCFLIYDHIGKTTSILWGRTYTDGSIRHPVIMYHIISAIAIIFLICYLKKTRLKEGIIVLFVALFYSVTRFFLDFLRCDDLNICDSRYYSLTYTQWLLLILMPFITYSLVTKIRSSKIDLLCNK